MKASTRSLEPDIANESFPAAKKPENSPGTPVRAAERRTWAMSASIKIVFPKTIKNSDSPIPDGRPQKPLRANETQADGNFPP
jgi:hypothetical protein